MPHPWLILFDIDATLLHTDGQGIDAMSRGGEEVFGGPFLIRGIQMAGSLDRVIYQQVMQANGVAATCHGLEAFRQAYVRLLETLLLGATSRARLLPGMDRLLALLRQRVDAQGDVVLGLLTGNDQLAVPVKLRSVGLDPDWFSITACGDEADHRRDLAELAIERFEAMTGQRVDPRRVVVIGDTPHDIDCALAHGCVAVGVATGMYPASVLAEHGADLVVESFADPDVLLQWLE